MVNSLICFNFHDKLNQSIVFIIFFLWLFMSIQYQKIREELNHNINSIFVNRWSPRSMTGEEIKDDDLMSLFEAARWAPSSFNNQPWRFIYSKRTGSEWSKFLDLLNEGNRIWAKDAGVCSNNIKKEL